MEPNKSRTQMAREIKAAIVRESTVPFCKISLTNEDCTVFDSKVGGLPYLPRGEQLPVGSDGNPLPLLAQINCEKLPALKDFPRKGMLQFFLNEADWRVVYHPEINAEIDMVEDTGENGVAEGEYKMHFALSEEGLTVGDFRFEREFLERWREIFPDEQPESIYRLRNVPNTVFYDNDSEEYGKHKIGGYAYFTQTDPRHDDTYDTLLFQLDTDMHDDVYVMYGDSGVIHFFINREALKNLDFSDVLWHGDCC